MKNTTEQIGVPSQSVTEATLKSLSTLLYSLVPVTTEELEAAPGLNAKNTERIICEFHASQPGLDEYLPAIEGMPLDVVAENSRAWDMARRIVFALEARFGWAPVLAADELRSTHTQAQKLLADPAIRAQVEKLPAVELAHHTFKNDPEDSQQVVKKDRVVIGVLTVLMCFSAAFANEAKRKTPGENRRSHGPTV